MDTYSSNTILKDGGKKHLSDLLQGPISSDMTSHIWLPEWHILLPTCLQVDAAYRMFDFYIASHLDGIGEWLKEQTLESDICGFLSWFINH